MPLPPHSPRPRPTRSAPTGSASASGATGAAAASFKDLLAGRRRRTRPGEFWALRDVSIEVRPGEAIGVVGRNGQGKSTLLKLVAGVMIADEGTVEVTGGVAPLIEITGGFVDDLTVRDNVYLTAGLHGMTSARDRRASSTRSSSSPRSATSSTRPTSTCRAA